MSTPEAVGATGSKEILVGGPYFEDLALGEVFDEAPALTLTTGHAALHQAILGDRLRLPLDQVLSGKVAGGSLVHPGLVCDVAIGQSTLATQRVVANLFYRGLVTRRPVQLGDTLATTTEVVGLRQNRPRDGRASTGLAALRVSTVDQEGRPVLDFIRCAMLPLRDPDARTGRADDLDSIPAPLGDADLAEAVGGWRLDRFREAASGAHFDQVSAGTRFVVEGGDVVSAAPELARLTLNIAMAHSDAQASDRGRRLVYGGHTIGLAGAHLARALPNLVTLVAWHGCDHLAPVHEGDTLRSRVTIERCEPLEAGGGLVHLRCEVTALRGGEAFPVLDWRPVGVMA